MSSPCPPSTKAVTSSTETFELLGEEITEARAVEHARHADDAMVGKPAGLAHDPDHGVERIGDDDDEGAGAMLLDRLADGRDDLGSWR